MPRLKKSESGGLFPNSSTSKDQVLSEQEKARLTRANLTAKLREQRLAKEAAEEEAAPPKKRKAVSARSAPKRTS